MGPRSFGEVSPESWHTYTNGIVFLWAVIDTDPRNADDLLAFKSLESWHGQGQAVCGHVSAAAHLIVRSPMKPDIVIGKITSNPEITSVFWMQICEFKNAITIDDKKKEELLGVVLEVMKKLAVGN